MNALEESRLPSLDGIKRPTTSFIPLRKGIIKLVNDCMAEAYKGANVPVLKPSNIQIVVDASNAEFTQAVADRVLHSSVQRRVARSNFSAMVMPLLQDRPIFLSESYVANLLKYPDRSEFGIAHILMHEVMHYLVKPKVIELDASHPMLEKIGLADHIKNNEALPEGESKDAAVDYYLKYLTSVIQNKPALLVEGAMVDLIVSDRDKSRKKVGANGYDLNEGIAEYLAAEPRKILEKYILRALGSREGSDLVEILRNAPAGSVVRKRISRTEILEIMASLQLKNTREVLKANRNSAFPELWVQHRPGELYP